VSPTAGSTERSPPSLPVRALLDDPGLGLELTLLAGADGVDRVIGHTRIQKSGLALVGHHHGIVSSRVQIMGQTELSYLHRLEPQARREALHGFFSLKLCCVVLTQGSRGFDMESSGASGEGVLPVPELLEAAQSTQTPLILSTERSSATIAALHALLDDRLAPRIRLHGVLVDVFGVGLLLSGSSGIGKSECALDLVMRGHRLVADDVVECDFRPPGMVFGTPADLLRHHLEVRGLGILNIKDLFGVTAIRERKRIDVVVKLVEWSRDVEYDRMGLEDRFHEILGVNVRELVIPVRPGRDMSSILEVAARNELLKNAGHHAAREFFDHLEGSLLNERTSDESAAPPPVNPPFRSPRPLPIPGLPLAPESSASIPRPRRP
jgi:HPr kinase/phosphorylase